MHPPYYMHLNSSSCFSLQLCIYHVWEDGVCRPGCSWGWHYAVFYILWRLSTYFQSITWSLLMKSCVICKQGEICFLSYQIWFSIFFFLPFLKKIVQTLFSKRGFYFNHPFFVLYDRELGAGYEKLFNCKNIIIFAEKSFIFTWKNILNLLQKVVWMR